MTGQNETINLARPRPVNAKWLTAAWALTALGAALSVAAILNETARVRFAFGYLWGFTLIWTVVLGSLFFVALQHLTASVWSVVLS